MDRDGVINEPVVREGRPYPPPSIKETIIVKDAQNALSLLKRRGFVLLVVTNQPDVRRGTMEKRTVDEIHHFLAASLPIDDFFVCYHDDIDACHCRKPLPGLLFEAAAKYGIDLSGSYLIGDRWRDIEAGIAAGCRKTVLIQRGYNERNSKFAPDVCVLSLSEAADWIIHQESELN